MQMVKFRVGLRGKGGNEFCKTIITTILKTIILYESFFGNTRHIAEAIGNSVAQNNEVRVLNVSEVSWKEISDAEILIVGSATRAFRPCEATKAFLKNIPENGLNCKKVAAFDTRILLSEIHSKVARYLVDKGGYAAKHIAKALDKKGGKLVLPPEGFFVKDEKGPLAEGELERAVKWAVQIVK
jgi:menaquinone-dependent protoporphyrinogen IX oxidase